MIVFESTTSASFYAISFDTNMFNDLQFYMQQQGATLHRIEPSQFLEGLVDPQGCYINLIIQDMQLRKTVSDQLDQLSLPRFSYIHPNSNVDGACVGAGSFLYPSAVLYRNSTIGKDNIIHSLVIVAHNSSTGTGCFMSGGTIVGGSTTIGDFCVFGIGVTVYDKVTIVSQVQLGARTIVRKNIVAPGKYGLGSKNQLVKLL
jgi:carbonic anhydrase/acetyltransferase-like protein (isoleucine patch superfamily)